jgi:Mrp family chromosome partitioning ATPase
MDYSARSDQPSFTWRRLIVGARRQSLVFVGAALLVAAGLAVADTLMFGGPHPLRSAAAGLFAGLLVAIGSEVSRNVVTSPAQLQRLSGGLPVLAIAPEVTPRTLRQTPPDLRLPHGVVLTKPESSYATSVRDLRFGIPATGLIAVVSCTPDEGATTTCLGIGASCQMEGRHALLIDCDLQRRSLTRTLGAAEGPGVLEVARGAVALMDAVQVDDASGLAFLPASPRANAFQDLIASPGFAAMIADAKKRFDLIVIDCPPLMASAQARTLARVADRCVLLVAWDKTPASVVRRSLVVMGRVGVRVLGIVLNRAPIGGR